MSMTFAPGDERELRQEGGTPQSLFDVLHEEYRFQVDMCASALNHKLDLYISKEMNVLSAATMLLLEGLRGYCNMPFNNIPPFLAIHLAARMALSCYMLPVRTDRYWWMQYKPRAECHYFVGEKPHQRVQFVAPPGLKYPSNTGGNCLFLFGEGCTPGLEVYRSGRTGLRLRPDEIPGLVR